MTRNVDTGDSTLLGVVRRSFSEFLMLPALIIAGFMVLAAATSLLDSAAPAGIEALRKLLANRLFSTAKTTSDLLGTVATGLVTVTSITISLLLLTLQQAASSLTHQVYDQYLRRRSNQVFFGFFIGVTLYALLTLATVDDSFNPVFGATLTLLLTAAALLLLLLLLYSAVDQMRPAAIIDTIHALALTARGHERALVAKTRRAPGAWVASLRSIAADRHGFVTGIDVEALGEALAGHGEAEIVLRIRMGDFVAVGDPLAELRTSPDVKVSNSISDAVRRCIRLERRRDIGCDPAFAVEQLETIAWTCISTAKSNPDPGLLCIWTLRDLLARWCLEEEPVEDAGGAAVIYNEDILARLMDALESLTVVASESMQHQTLAELLHTLTLIFDRLPSPQQARAEDVALRSLSALGEHVLTLRLENALGALAAKFSAAGRGSTAAALEVARERLARSVGRINSRAGRASAGN